MIMNWAERWGHVKPVAFFIHLGTTAIPAYYVALAMQYLLVIEFNLSEKRIWENFERYFHMTIIPIAVAWPVIPIPLDLYNP